MSSQISMWKILMIVFSVTQPVDITFLLRLNVDPKGGYCCTFLHIFNCFKERDGLTSSVKTLSLLWISKEDDYRLLKT